MVCLSTCLSGKSRLQLVLNGGPDVVRFAKGQFTSMGLEPLQQFIRGHDSQGHDCPVVSALDVLGVVQWLTC